MSDPRAFGYIFGSPDQGHRFFGIKTDKHANFVSKYFTSLFTSCVHIKCDTYLLYAIYAFTIQALFQFTLHLGNSVINI